MKYSVWEVTEGFQRIRCLVEVLSPNKKKLRGKWQIFLKEYRTGGNVIGFHAEYPNNHFIAVFDERMDVVRNRIKWTK